MRQLSETLLAAQQQAAATPYVKVVARNMAAGVVRARWGRFYEGSEDGGPHAVTLPADGSLIRVRVTPAADSRKLYRQRVAAPLPESNYSQWTYTGHYNVLAVAAASLGSEAAIFWINSSREIRCIVSADNGASWGSPELIDYTPTTSACGVAAAYRPDADLAVFYADQANLYVKKLISGQWQAASAWDKTTGDISGVAVAYDGDWNLLVTGRDSAGNYKLWSLVYGDGGDVAAGTWSALCEVASAPAGGDFLYSQPFLDKPDVFRCFYTEHFTGTEAYRRPFWSHLVAGSAYTDSLWREPVPFEVAAEYGLALGYHDSHAWLSCPDGVWRACLAPESLELTADVVAIRQEADGDSGLLRVELRNDDGRYASPGEGDLAVLEKGCQVDFGPGYVSSAGSEYSGGQCYMLEACEHASAGGRAVLILHARSGWGEVEGWRARHQFRWNKSDAEYSAAEILAFVLARAGLSLEVISQSAAISGFYPDFSINPGHDGRRVIRKLLSFAPDLLSVEGNSVFLVNPQPSDGSVYSYGGSHVVGEGRYRQGSWGFNRVQVEGYDDSGGQIILADSMNWDEVGRMYDRLLLLDDRNLGTVAAARQRGQAWLRRAEVEAVSGSIVVPVNCGQQLYDVIDVTDARAGLSGEKRRVIAMSLVYDTRRGEYHQRLQLGAV